MRKYYTVYLRETDEVIAHGTSRECAAIMGKSLNCFHSMVSKTLKGKHNKYDILVEPLDFTEDDKGYDLR